MVHKANELKKLKGVLCELKKKQGKILSPETLKAAATSYQSDNFSRMCPGNKEYDFVKIIDRV